MSKYRIYILPITFFFWFLVFGFEVNALNILLAGIAGVAAYALVGSLEKAERASGVGGALEMGDAPDELDNLLALIDEQAERLHDTPIEGEILGVRENLAEIHRSIQSHPEQAKNNYLRRFASLYVRYSNGLTSDYLSLNRMSAPAGNLAKTQELYLERFRLLRSASEAILNDIYRTQAWGLAAENKALEQVFAPLENADDFGGVSTEIGMPDCQI